MSDENNPDATTGDGDQTDAAEADMHTPVDDGSIPVLDHVIIPGDMLASDEHDQKQPHDEATQDIHSALDMMSERPVVTQEIRPQTEDVSVSAEPESHAASDMATTMLYELTDRLHARLSPQIESLVEHTVRDAVIAALAEAGPAISNKVQQSLESRVEEMLAESIAVAIDELVKEQSPQDNQ